MKKLATDKIMKLYEENSHMLKETFEALGEAGKNSIV